MKRMFIFMVSLFLFVIAIHADERKKVHLDDEQVAEQISLSFCNLFVTKVDADDENAKITIELENLNESEILILFGHAYPEKALKKLSPSIRFDKQFSGPKGRRIIDISQDVRNVLFINPSDKRFLPEIQIKGGETRLCRLPLYIAKYKGKKGKKVLLLDKQIIELEIEVEVKPDADFLRLDKEVDDLIKEIDRQTFCTNSKHKGSLKQQTAPYEKKISKIKTEIENILSRHEHDWYSNDREYQRYAALKQKLSNINLKHREGDCGKHGRGRDSKSHTCKYCNLSLQQIYHKLDDYYKKIYNSHDRTAVKEAVMADVNLLYSCCTDEKCTKHSSWNNSEYKTKITDRYNRISKF